jgi:hypothetical protein
MKVRMILFVLALSFVAAALCVAADDAYMGTWKLNEAKSKIPAGMNKNTTVVYAADGENVKITVDGVDAKGAPAHNEWTGKFDGKDYAVTGDPEADMRSYKMEKGHLELWNKKEGKVTAHAMVEVSKDGKTRTVTLHSKDDKGKEMTTTAVYDKQ